MNEEAKTIHSTFPTRSIHKTTHTLHRLWPPTHTHTEYRSEDGSAVLFSSLIHLALLLFVPLHWAKQTELREAGERNGSINNTNTSGRTRQRDRETERARVRGTLRWQNTDNLVDVFMWHHLVKPVCLWELEANIPQLWCQCLFSDTAVCKVCVCVCT